MAVALSTVCLVLASAVFALPNEPRIINNSKVSNEIVTFPGKPVFDFRKNGWNIDVRVVPSVNASNAVQEDDRFPAFPIKEIGNCILDFSWMCVQKRISRYVDDIDQLDEFTLFGNVVKVVRAKPSSEFKSTERQLIVESASDRIDRSIDNFFDTHAMRITLPKWNGKFSQINIMYDDSIEEGRGKKGGGKGGGKCKKMMMMMFGMMKMKLMGMVGLGAMKGMMMAGMSLMLSKMMLIMKLMSLKKGGGFGGGGGD